MRKILFILLFVYGSVLCFAQRKFPLVNFTPRDYGKNHSAQNWGIARDKNGVLYFGNDNGLLVYDGIRWSFLPVVNGKKIFSIAIDKEDNIFIGSYGEFGWIPRNEKGYGEYESLSEKLNNDDKKFSQVWRVFCLPSHEVVFQSQECVGIYNYSVTKIVKPQNSFHLASFDGEKVYLRERGKGILVYENHNWKSIQTELPFDSYGLFAVLPFNDKKRSLWITQELGLYVFNSSNGLFSEFSPVNKSEILSAEIIGGIKLYNGFFALNSAKSGVLIFNEEGRLIQKLDNNIGLRDNNVVQQCLDSQGNLWISQGNGISKIQFPSKFEIFDWHDGFEAKVYKVIQTNESWWAATDVGLMRWENFRLVNVALQGELVWDLLEFENKLVLATPHGLHLFQNGNVKKISEIPVRSLHVSAKHQLIAGTQSGIEIYNTEFKKIYNGDFLLSEALGIASVKRSNNSQEIWVSAIGELAKILDEEGKPLQINILGTDNGLPKDWMYPLIYNAQLVLGTNYGLYNEKLDKNGFSIFENIAFPDANADASFHFLQEDKASNTTGAIVNNKVYFSRNNLNASEDFLCLDMGRKNALAFSENKIALACDEGIVFYHLQNEMWNFPVSSDIILRKLICADDSLLWNGSFKSEYKLKAPLEYRYNSMQIEFGCTQMTYPDKNLFTYVLLHSDDTLRKSHCNGKIDLQNLSEGDYRLIISGMDVWRNKMRPIAIHFRVLPPWYRTSWAYLAYVGLLIVLIIVSGKIFSYNLKQTNKRLEELVKVRTSEIENKNQELHLQNEKILEQKQEITDSINYAKRIQMAVLVPQEEIIRHFGSMFILFKPKDIVSGDFYWYHKLSENEFFIACADCTGHGVPGGFMSMICTEKLNESLNYTTEPDEMLKHVNMVLKNALRQDGETGSTKDGMEIALLKINSHLKTVRYSGANRFLWIIRNNADFIEEIKPVKTGIGGTTPSDQNFETHELIIQAGDSVYMSSDGYADQFGGTDARRNGKKFMTKNFKTLLLSIKDMPMKDQGEALDTTIQKWKGDYEQVDDILVIGLRF